MNVHKKLRRYSDQNYCAECGKQWDINDPEPPVCTAKKTREQWIAELKNILKKDSK